MTNVTLMLMNKLRMLKIDKQVHENIVKANARYQHKVKKELKGNKQLQIGDFAWIHLKKERFP